MRYRLLRIEQHDNERYAVLYFCTSPSVSGYITHIIQKIRISFLTIGSKVAELLSGKVGPSIANVNWHILSLFSKKKYLVLSYRCINTDNLSNEYNKGILQTAADFLFIVYNYYKLCTSMLSFALQTNLLTNCRFASFVFFTHLNL